METRTYVTLGADENGQVYGLELDGDGLSWRINPLSYSTSCVVIRPVSKEQFDYMTKDEESVIDLWRLAVSKEKTELGLKDWFDSLDKEEMFDVSWVDDLLNDCGNPTVSSFKLKDGGPTFKDFVEETLIKTDDVTKVSSHDDIRTWEACGSFPPNHPFVVEFAPKKLINEYYRHLRKTYEQWREHNGKEK